MLAGGKIILSKHDALLAAQNKRIKALIMRAVDLERALKKVKVCAENGMDVKQVIQIVDSCFPKQAEA